MNATQMSFILGPAKMKLLQLCKLRTPFGEWIFPLVSHLLAKTIKRGYPFSDNPFCSLARPLGPELNFHEKSPEPKEAIPKGSGRERKP
jgi:hypothetical protein